MSEIQTIETKIETEAKKIEIDAKQLWAWFEEHIGITHTTQRAAQALNTIVPKPEYSPIQDGIPNLGQGIALSPQPAIPGESPSPESLPSNASETLSTGLIGGIGGSDPKPVSTTAGYGGAESVNYGAYANIATPDSVSGS